MKYASFRLPYGPDETPGHDNQDRHITTMIQQSFNILPYGPRTLQYAAERKIESLRLRRDEVVPWESKTAVPSFVLPHKAAASEEN
jgi:hypothetical protein